jgi:malate dehydrogenase (oxaloacetate-decarboxylating)(NADP+)
VIQRHPDSVYRYTNKGHLGAIVSNGTAVLDLGHLGPLPAKSVMKGRSLLFKRLADIGAFDLSPERITFRLRPVKDAGVNSKPGP